MIISTFSLATLSLWLGVASLGAAATQAETNGKFKAQSHNSKNRWQWFAGVESFNYSEPVKLKALGNNWDDDFAGGDLIYSHTEAFLGLCFRGFSLTVFNRLDYFFEFNRDLAQLVYLDENDIDIPEGDYSLRLDATHFFAYGLMFGYRFAGPRGHWEPRIKLLKGRYFQDAEAQGQVFLQEDGELITGQLDLDYFYSEDLILEHQATQYQGLGYALDLDFSRRWGAWHLAGQLSDLGGRIFWRDAPFSYYNPRGTGGRVRDILTLRATQDFWQALPLRSQTQLNRKLASGQSLGVKLSTLDEHHFSYLTWASGSATNALRETGYGPWFANLGLAPKSLGLGWQRAGLRLYFESDWALPANAHLLNLMIDYRLAF